jgi:hypothetical protein
VALGWAAASLLTAASPLTLLAEAFPASAPNEYQYLGLLTFLKWLAPLSDNAILAANLLFGAAYVLLLWRYLKRSGVPETSPVYVGVVCAASTFCSYKNMCDYVIFSFCALLLCALALRAKTARRFWAVLALVAITPVCHRLLAWLRYFPPLDSVPSDVAVHLPTSVFFCLCGILLCWFWVKERMELE